MLSVELGVNASPHNIFVYGTLKRGFSNHSLLADQHFVAVGHTGPLYKLYALAGFPAMIDASAGGRSIEGEIWQIDPTCLARLDELEDTANGLYARVPIHLLPPHETLAVEAYVYLLSITGRTELGNVWPE